MKIKEILHETITYLLYFLLLSVPLISFKGVNEIFEFPKMTFVYILGGLIISFFVIKRILEKNRATFFKMRIDVLDKLVLAFLGVNFIAYVFSMAKYTSFWGYYTRFNGGLVSIAIFTGLYFVVKYELAKEEQKKLLYFVMFSAIPVYLYAIAQNLGFEKGYWQEDSQARVFATLGQPNWLAAFLLLTVFPILAKFKDQTNPKIKAFFGVLFLMNFSALWFTYSLSGLLGYSIGLITFLALSFKEPTRKSVMLLLGLSFVICVIRPGVIKPKFMDAILDVKTKFGINSKNQGEKTDQTAPVAEKVEKPTPTTEEQAPPRFGDTTAIRLIVWKGSLALITASVKNVVAGTGPETYPYAFLKFRPLELNHTSEKDFIFNKPHNYYIELMCNLGIFGLLVYFAILAVTLKTTVAKHLDLFCAVIALAISNLFGWNTVTTNLIFFTYLAIGSAKESSKITEKKKTIAVTQTTKIGAVKLGLIATVLMANFKLSTTALNMFLADKYYTESKISLYKGGIKDANNTIIKAVKLNPLEPTYLRQNAAVLLTATLLSEEAESNAALKQSAFENLERAYQLQPYNLVNVKNLIPFYYLISVKDIRVENKELEPFYRLKALEFFAKVRDMAKNDASMYQLLARHYALLGENEVAQELNAKAEELLK